VKKNRIFNEKELKEMGRATQEVALEAVEAGDKKKAKEYINRMGEESIFSHDAYMNWVVELLDYIYVHDGPEALEKAIRKNFEREEGELIESFKKMGLREQVQTYAKGLRMHFQKLEIKEDDEKVSIKMVPCGSGQRLLESGAYDPPRRLSRMKPHRITWNRPNFPIYCAHGPLQEIIAIEKLGHPLYVHWFPDEVATESCRFCFYKDPKRIPEEVYKRVGMKKPE
jgi:hypothetical protein